MKRHARRVLLAVALMAAGVLIAVLTIAPRVEHRLTHKTLAPATVAPALTCPGDQATMNCVLQNQAPPVSTAQSIHPSGGNMAVGTVTATQTAAATSIYGVDFGWSTLTAAGLTAIHAKFAASYISHDVSKAWTVAAVAADHAAGIATVAVFEDTANRAQAGFAAGVADAQLANADAAAIGNTTETIDFAVDCDCAVSSITSYFQGVHSVLGARAGIYGGYDQVAGIHALGLVGDRNWQTYAWSSGRWLPASIAPLEQYLNGSAYDNDRAIAANYGQWPAPAARHPGGGRRHWTWLPDTRRSFRVHSRTIHARERLAVETWDKHHCVNPVRRAVCRETRAHLQLLADRIAFVAHHTGRHLRHESRRPRWGALHYRAPHHRTTLGGGYRQLHRRSVATKPVTRW